MDLVNFRKIFVAILFLVIPIAIHAQGSQRIGQATQNVNGFVKVVPGASVQVCPFSFSLVCVGAVNIYSNTSLTLRLPNPFKADQNGNYYYYAAPGTYLEKVSSPGTEGVTIPITTTGGTNAIFTPGAIQFAITPTTARAATFSDIVALWSTCSGIQYLGADGVCHTSSGNPFFANAIQFATSTTNVRAATSADVISLWSSCTGVQYLGADGNCYDSGNGAISPSPQFQVAYFDQSGSIGHLDGAGGITVDSAGQTVLNATGGVTTGSVPPPCATGSLCLGQGTVPSPLGGVNVLTADSVTGVFLQTLGTNSAVPVPNSATPPLALSSTGVLSVALGTNSAPGVLQCDNTTTTCSGGVISAAGGGGGGGVFTYFQNPSGTIDGTNGTFTLSAAPTPGNSLSLYLDGSVLTAGAGGDYTLSGATISFTTSVPRTGATLRATYETSASSSTYSFFETPSGSVNSSNGTFGLAHTPSPSNSVNLYVAGQVLVQGVDYTLATATITFTTTVPQTGDVVRATYTY